MMKLTVDLIPEMLAGIKYRTFYRLFYFLKTEK
jgi:hypothetical protein